MWTGCERKIGLGGVIIFGYGPHRKIQSCSPVRFTRVGIKCLHLYLQTNIAILRIVSFCRILFVTSTRKKTFPEEIERRRNISADRLEYSLSGSEANHSACGYSFTSAYSIDAWEYWRWQCTTGFLFVSPNSPMVHCSPRYYIYQVSSATSEFPSLPSPPQEPINVGYSGNLNLLLLIYYS